MSKGGSSGYSPNQLLKPNSLVSQANMSRLLKQMSLIVSTELQQIAIDLYEKMDESGGDKPVKYIKLKDEFRQQAQHSHASRDSTGMLVASAPSLPISHSSPQFKSMIGTSSSVQSSQLPQSSQPISSAAPTLPAATKQQLSALIQMNSLTASFKKVDLATTSKPKQTSQTPIPHIINPKKDLEFIAKDKKNNSADQISAFRSTASSSFFYSTDTC